VSPTLPHNYLNFREPASSANDNIPPILLEGSLDHNRLKSKPRLPIAARQLLVILTATGLGLGIANPSYSTLPPERLIAQQPQNLSQPSQILYVSPTTGNDQGAGSQQFPFQTLTRALQSAQPNTAIILAPGTYSEQTGEQFPLRLQPNITIQGNPETKGQDIVIYGGGFYTSRTSAKQNITVLGANGARISGVTITNPYDRGYGLWIESASLIVSQNTFTGNTHDGISVVGTGAPLIQNNIFRENGANGVTVFGSAQPEIRENEFQNTGFGINIAQQAAPFIVGNRIIYNKDGVVIQGNARPVLRENYIEQNQRDGIVAIAQGIADLGNVQEPGRNVIQNNGRYDVHNGTKGQRLLAYGNQLSPQQIAGVVDWGGNMNNPAGLTQPLTAAATPVNPSESNASRRSPINTAADLPVFIPDPNTASVPAPTPQTPTVIPIAVPPPESSQEEEIAIQPASVPTNAQYHSIRPTLQPATSPKTEPVDERSDLLSQLRSQAANAIEIPVPPPESNQSARVIYPLSTQPNVTTPSAPASGILPVPGSQIPISDQGYLPTGLEANSTTTPALTPIATTLLGLQYRVVVEDTSESSYQQVRRFVPEAFRTVVKNRSVIQVGAFRDRNEANHIWRQLNQNRIPAKIEPFN
jgi:parallel beta-helix repeat protein